MCNRCVLNTFCWKYPAFNSILEKLFVVECAQIVQDPFAPLKVSVIIKAEAWRSAGEAGHWIPMDSFIISSPYPAVVSAVFLGANQWAWLLEWNEGWLLNIIPVSTKHTLRQTKKFHNTLWNENPVLMRPLMVEQFFCSRVETPKALSPFQESDFCIRSDLPFSTL